MTESGRNPDIERRSNELEMTVGSRNRPEGSRAHAGTSRRRPGKGGLENVNQSKQVRVGRPIDRSGSSQRPLRPGEHRSPARRRSWRAYYWRNAQKIRASATSYYWSHYQRCLEVKRKFRSNQWRLKWGRCRLTEQDWVNIRRFYETTKAMGDSITFRALSARFRISQRAIQRRSSAEGGWAMRACR
jgi:hypothetical protein